jgi:hypothetical protein
MVDVSTIAGALSALKASKDIAEAMIGLRDAAAFNEKRLELQSRIMDAQSSVFTAQEERASLLDKVGKLEKHIADMETWEAEKERYQLKAVAGGAFAYTLKPEMSGGEPAHWLCATCYQSRKKAFLQASGKAAMQGADVVKIRWKCFSCESEIRVHFSITPESVQQSNS